MTTRPTPTPNLDTRGWWQALTDGTVTAPHCGQCDALFFPPQPFCPRCGAPGAALKPLEKAGRVYSWVVVHRAFGAEWAHDVPYAIVAVDMIDGVRLTGRYLGDPAELVDGSRVVAQPYDAHGPVLLGFSADSQ